MNIDIAPDTARLVREELRSGHFRSVDDLIPSSVHAWRERHQAALGEPRTSKESLVAFFRNSPLVGLELEFPRDAGTGFLKWFASAQNRL